MFLKKYFYLLTIVFVFCVKLGITSPVTGITDTPKTRDPVNSAPLRNNNAKIKFILNKNVDGTYNIANEGVLLINLKNNIFSSQSDLNSKLSSGIIGIDRAITTSGLSQSWINNNNIVDLNGGSLDIDFNSTYFQKVGGSLDLSDNGIGGDKIDYTDILGLSKNVTGGQINVDGGIVLESDTLYLDYIYFISGDTLGQKRINTAIQSDSVDVLTTSDTSSVISAINSLIVINIDTAPTIFKIESSVVDDTNGSIITGDTTLGAMDAVLDISNFVPDYATKIYVRYFVELQAQAGLTAQHNLYLGDTTNILPSVSVNQEYNGYAHILKASNTDDASMTNNFWLKISDDKKIYIRDIAVNIQAGTLGVYLNILGYK